MTVGANLHTVACMSMNVGNKQFREYIDAVKAVTGLSPTAIATKAGLSSSTVNTPYYRPELGVTPTLRTINKIAKATDVPFDPMSFDELGAMEDIDENREKARPRKKPVFRGEKVGSDAFQRYMKSVISQTGLSPTMIAKISGVSGPTLTNAYYTGAPPTRRTVDRIAQATGIPFAGATEGVTTDDENTGRDTSHMARCQPIPVPLDVSALEKDLPIVFLHIIEVPSNNKLEGYSMKKNAIEFCRRPPGVAGAPNAYAIYAPDDALVKYDSGDLLFLVPDRPVKPGDHALVHVQYKMDQEPVVHLGRLTARSATSITLSIDRPEPTQQRIALDKIVSIHKILSNREIFGI